MTSKPIIIDPGDGLFADGPTKTVENLKKMLQDPEIKDDPDLVADIEFWIETAQSLIGLVEEPKE